MTRHWAFTQLKLRGFFLVSFASVGCALMASDPEDVLAPSPAFSSDSESKQKTSKVTRLEEPQSILGYASAI